MVTSGSDPKYRQCSISVMDNIADPGITFNEEGICNYYFSYQQAAKASVFTGRDGQNRLDRIVSQIKASGMGKQYDCITGVSGGVDSTYLALQAKKLGLRPLIVHFDNGWNSELAVKNIENIISRLGFDLHTLVVDWEEFRDLQISYLKASVVDIEAVTDHAIIGTLYRLAAKKGIKYILSGANIVTEFVLPSYWIWSKYDSLNIRAIHERFGKVPLRTFPIFPLWQKEYYTRIKKIQTISLLNYLPYNKSEVKAVIADELGWKDYGGKHYESVFTRFYQGYILPEKFHIDKRKAHLSTLIFSGQITKVEAIEELKKPIYDPKQFNIDREFVIKKLNMSESEFHGIMKEPRREHWDYPHAKRVIWDSYPILKPLRGVWQKLK